MLIFSRKSGEHFTIGDNVTVTVRRIRGNRVTLSFDAPAAVRIARQEAADPASEPQIVALAGVEADICQSSGR